MADIKKEQQETTALIDTAKAMMDKVLTIMELSLGASSVSVNLTSNPMQYLMKLLRASGVTDETLKDFITYILLGALPALEISIKAVLLTNLKNLISCSTDPRIPEQYRKMHVAPGDSQTGQRRGINVDIQAIDMFQKLSVSPLSDAGRQYYFGLEGVQNVYQFARADDMDAFLWFVKNKGKFPAASKISTMADFSGSTIGAESITPSDATLFSAFELAFKDTSPSKVLLGNTFMYSGDSRIYSICAESKYDDTDNIIHNTLLPVSDDQTSVNWYIRRADQLAKNIGIGWNSKKSKTSTKTGRDFSKERAICNIQYEDNVLDGPLNGLVSDKFIFAILPKPYVHIPDIGHGEPPWRFKKILFNDKGELDPNGKLTLAGIPIEKYKDGDIIISGGTGNNKYQLKLDVNSGTISFVEGTSKEKMVKNIVECYPGLTVYEFNYDYVMGMKLFDAKTIATQLFNTLMDIRLGIGTEINFGNLEINDGIKDIIREIINSDDSEVNDCYFSFNNSKYSALMRQAEIRRANANDTRAGVRAAYDDLVNTISEFDENATLNEQKETLTRAINSASAMATEGVDETDKVTVEFNFVSDLIENLIQAIVYSIMSPKVLMLLDINEQLMGGKWTKFTVRDLLSSMRGIIIGIINEVRDFVLQELLKLLMNQLQPLIELMSSLIAREQIEDYVDAINEIIRNCPSIWFKFGNQYLDTSIANVDYADIDLSKIRGGDTPNDIC